MSVLRPYVTIHQAKIYVHHTFNSTEHSSTNIGRMEKDDGRRGRHHGIQKYSKGLFSPYNFLILYCAILVYISFLNPFDIFLQSLFPRQLSYPQDIPAFCYSISLVQTFLSHLDVFFSACLACFLCSGAGADMP
uniref:Uncharacterized protein n=1 Tax=Bionectria ochroleuca TaxID=29856 RepID=A0A8H7MZD1_BIOOC